jgi:hypothetical protein
MDEAARHAAIQEFPNILRNSQVHRPAHKNYPLTPIVSQMNPDHTTSS